MARRFHDNPFSVLAPRRIWIPVSAGAAAFVADTTEAAAGVDVASVVGTLIGAATEVSAGAAIESATLAAVAAITEPAATVDVAAVIATLASAATEPAAGAEIANSDVQGVATGDVTESAAGSDLRSTIATMGVAAVESASVVDIGGGARVTAATLSDGVAVFDLVNFGAATHEVTRVEAAAGADLVNRVLAALGVASEAAAGTEIVAVLMSAVADATEGALGSDAPAATYQTAVAIMEAVAGRDVAATSAGGVFGADAIEAALGLDVPGAVLLLGLYLREPQDVRAGATPRVVQLTLVDRTDRTVTLSGHPGQIGNLLRH
jgi:hypothetical protein